jgi:hypothetical protein
MFPVMAREADFRFRSAGAKRNSWRAFHKHLALMGRRQHNVLFHFKLESANDKSEMTNEKSVVLTY